MRFASDFALKKYIKTNNDWIINKFILLILFLKYSNKNIMYLTQFFPFCYIIINIYKKKKIIFSCQNKGCQNKVVFLGVKIKGVKIKLFF